MLYIIAYFLISYLMGSVSFAIVVSHVMNLADPRTYGSGNPGATNILRSGNKIATGLTLLGDGGKGYCAIKLIDWLSVFLTNTAPSDEMLGAALLGVFLGHIFPLFHRFKGGKGVITAAGALGGIHPILFLGALTSWLLSASLFRISSLSALIAAVLIPPWYLLHFGIRPMFWFVMSMALILIARHHRNIVKLWQGTEKKIGDTVKTE